MSSNKKFKLVLLGEAGVGKSSIVLRLIKDEYVEYQHSTVGASFFRHSVPVSDVTVNFDIWDTAGQERFKSLASMYYRGASAALVVYDITNPESFDRAKYWVHELNVNSQTDIVIALTGNKCDLQEQRQVPLEQVKTYAEENGLIYFETSARSGENVKEVFAEIAGRLSAHVTAGAAPAPADGRVRIDERSNPSGEKKKKCC